MFQQTKLHHIERFWVLGCLLLAAGLRLGWPGLTEFKADEAHLLTLALDMADGQFAWRGISNSVGFPNFPLSVWLYALPVLIWAHPYAATLFTGLLNTLGVAAAYWFTRRYWGSTAALVATLWYAVTPWAVFFSRKIWAQNLLPLFVIGWAITAGLGFVEGRRRWTAVHLLLLALTIQIHLAAVALLPVTAVLLYLFRRRISGRWLLLGVAMGVATAVPFLIYLGQHPSQIAWPVGANRSFSLDAWRFVALISQGSQLHSLTGPQAFTDYLAQVPWGTAVSGLWGLFILSGLAYVAGQTATWLMTKNKQTSPQPITEMNLILLLWLLLPPLLFSWPGLPVFPHYFITTFPAQYILVGILVNRLLTHRPTRHPQAIPRLLWAVVILSAGLQLISWGTLLTFVQERATLGGFGLPLKIYLQATDQAKQMMAEVGAEEVIIAGQGDSPDTAEFAAIFHTLWRDVPHRLVDGRTSALFPAQPAVVLLENDPVVQEMGRVYGRNATLSWATRLPSPAGAFQIIGLPGQAAPTPDVPFHQTYLWRNWVSPVGYTWTREGETAVFDLTWHTADTPDPASYHFFTHLLAENGQRLSQYDAPAFAPWQWQRGDVVVSRFLLANVPANEYLTLQVGLYHYPSLEPVPLLDAAANPYREALEIILSP